MKAYRLNYGSFDEILPSEAATARGAVYYGENLYEVLETLENNGVGDFIFAKSKLVYQGHDKQTGENIYEDEPVMSPTELWRNQNTRDNQQHFWIERKHLTDDDVINMLEFDPDGKRLKGINFNNFMRDISEANLKYFTKTNTWSPATTMTRMKQARKKNAKKLKKQKEQNDYRNRMPSPTVLKPMLTEMRNTVAEGLMFFTGWKTGYIPNTVEYADYIKKISPFYDTLMGKKNAYRDLDSYRLAFSIHIQPKIKVIREAVRKDRAHPVWHWVAKEYPTYLRNARKNKETSENV